MNVVTYDDTLGLLGKDANHWRKPVGHCRISSLDTDRMSGRSLMATAALSPMEAPRT